MMVPSKGTPLRLSVRVRAVDTSHLPSPPTSFNLLDADSDSGVRVSAATAQPALNSGSAYEDDPAYGSVPYHDLDAGACRCCPDSVPGRRAPDTARFSGT
jgi:hypothetical protein